MLQRTPFSFVCQDRLTIEYSDRKGCQIERFDNHLYERFNLSRKLSHNLTGIKRSLLLAIRIADNSNGGVQLFLSLFNNFATLPHQFDPSGR